MAIPKKEQFRLLLSGIQRLHFHRSLSNNKEAEEEVTELLINIADQLMFAERIQNEKEREAEIERIYESLRNLP